MSRQRLFDAHLTEIGDIMKFVEGTKSAPDKLPPVTIDRTLAFVRPVTIKAHDHWIMRKGSRIMPARTDIIPGSLRDVLPQIGLVDVPRDGQSGYVIRLAGDAIQRVFGPLAGRPLTEILPPQIAERWVATFDETVREAAPLRATGRVAFRDMAWLQYEVFLAPLGTDGEISAIFGALDVWPSDDHLTGALRPQK